MALFNPNSEVAWARCASRRGTARCAPTPGPAPFCSSGICVERASNQVDRLERRLPTSEFGFNGNEMVCLAKLSSSRPIIAS